MSCNLRGKVTIVSVNINFGAKMSILCKKIEILGGKVSNLDKKNFNFLGYVNLYMC